MNIDPWQVQTKELLNMVESEIREAREDFDKHSAVLEEERQALARALDSYSKRKGMEAQNERQELRPSDVKDKSFAQILKLIAERNNSLLVVKVAKRLMISASVFGDSLNADSMIYTTLRRSKDFVKVTSGVYKLKSTSTIDVPRKTRPESTGLVDKVSSLMKQHHEWKPKDLLEELQQQGWDFKGKIPASSVTIAYARVIKEQKHIITKQMTS